MLFGILGGGNRSPKSITWTKDVPAAATAAVVTIAAVANRCHILHKVLWSYSAAPTGGRLTIAGGATILDIDITNSGPGPLSITYVCNTNTALVVTLASGAGSVAGKLNIQHTTEAN